MDTPVTKSWNRTASGVIEPLAAWATDWPVRTVPEPLDAIFLADATKTYAVIDAAKVFGLRELLQASGLEHSCLYLGDAGEQWGDVGPWLVRLDPRHDLTRRLFLDDTAPAALSFRKGTTLFLTTPDDCPTVLRHLRRFTKVRAEDGRILMLRFYDPVTFSDLQEVMPPWQMAEILGQMTVTCLHPDGHWYCTEAVTC